MLPLHAPGDSGSGGGSGSAAVARRGLSLRLLPLLFIVSLSAVVLLGFTLWQTPQGAQVIIPLSVSQLRPAADGLRMLERHNPGLFLAFVTAAYLVKQTFAIPGSAVLNALCGVVYEFRVGLPLVVLLSCLGSTCGYFVSKAFGGRLLQKYRLDERLWPIRMQVEAARKNGTLFFTLLSMRIFPGSPHWAINYTAPHAGVGVPVFMAASALGMSGYNALCVYAGASIDAASWEEVFSWGVAGKLALLALICALPALLPKQVRGIQKSCTTVLRTMLGRPHVKRKSVATTTTTVAVVSSAHDIRDDMGLSVGDGGDGGGGGSSGSSAFSGSMVEQRLSRRQSMTSGDAKGGSEGTIPAAAVAYADSNNSNSDNAPMMMSTAVRVYSIPVLPGVSSAGATAEFSKAGSVDHTLAAMSSSRSEKSLQEKKLSPWPLGGSGGSGGISPDAAPSGYSFSGESATAAAAAAAALTTVDVAVAARPPGDSWLSRIVAAIRGADGGALLTRSSSGGASTPDERMLRAGRPGGGVGGAFSEEVDDDDEKGTAWATNYSGTWPLRRHL